MSAILDLTDPRTDRPERGRPGWASHARAVRSYMAMEDIIAGITDHKSLIVKQMTLCAPSITEDQAIRWRSTLHSPLSEVWRMGGERWGWRGWWWGGGWGGGCIYIIVARSHGIIRRHRNTTRWRSREYLFTLTQMSWTMTQMSWTMTWTSWRVH